MNVQSNDKMPTKRGYDKVKSGMPFGVIVTIIIIDLGLSLDQASFFSPVGLLKQLVHLILRPIS